jgi:phosphoglycerate dehydrogenase-like enzyme
LLIDRPAVRRPRSVTIQQSAISIQQSGMRILISIHSPFVMWNIPSGHVERLRREFPAHDFLHAGDDGQALEMAAEADSAFSSHVTREQLLAAPKLQWIHSPAAGVGGMLFREMVESPVVITNSRGMSAETIAEHVVAVMLALFRNLPLAVRRQSEGVWAQDEISARGNRTIAGSTVLVVGLGAIGAAAARRISALGARVIGVRRQRDAPGVEGVSVVFAPHELREALASADAVVIAAPHTRQTRGLIGRAELDAMKQDAVLVNVSRGRLVEEAALVATLRAGRLGGVALDVFEREPLAADSPLWTFPNVLITPHTSGFRPDHWDAATDLFAENLRRFEAGHALLNVVDKREGY